MKKTCLGINAGARRTKINERPVTTLTAAYDDIASKSLAPLAQLESDSVRISIDDALCTVLELPSLAPVRALLAREPGLTGQKIGPNFVQNRP